MIAIEVLKYNRLTQPIINDAPFCYYSQISNYELASYWTSTFGAPEESETGLYFINSLIVNGNVYYIRVDTYAEYLAQEKSFYWDNVNQRLYFHIDHLLSAYSSTYEYSSGVGFTNKGVVYVDGLPFKPLIDSIPSISQQQDLQNYDKLSFVNGTIVLNNTGGILDYFITENLHGNEVFLYYIEDGKKDYSRSELVNLRAFYVEDYQITQQKIDLRVQDIRQSQNIKIPTELFLESDYPNIKDTYKNKPIPLALGPIYISEAKPTNSETTGNVNYRQAITLTSLGTVQVYSDDEWITRTPTSINLETGEFTLSYLHARKGGTTTGSVLKCRVIGSVGVSYSYASDYIKYINQRYINISYLPSLYDTTEWESAETELSNIGLLVEKSTELYNVIRDIQNGANVGFRYDIKGDGKRTIRIDDYDRAVSSVIYHQYIENVTELPVDGDSELLAAVVEVLYNHDYNDDENLSAINSDYSDNTFNDYRQRPSVQLESSLTNSTDAESKALWFAERYYQIPKILNIKLLGSKFLTLRIYDTIIIEITDGFVNLADNSITGNREYYGIWKAQILSINPDMDKPGNEISVVLIEKQEQITEARITEGSYIRLLEDGITKRTLE